jgi:sugar phosphate permease
MTHDAVLLWLSITARILLVWSRIIDQSRTHASAPWLNWGIAATFAIFSVFSVVSIAVLTESIEQGTELSTAVISSIASVYFFTFAIAQLIAGMFIDRIGPRWLLSATAAIAALGGVLFVSSNSMWMLYLARGLMGVGLSSAFVGALYMGRTWFPASRYAFMSGLTQMAANLGGAIGSVAIATAGYVPVVLVSAFFNMAIVVLIILFIANRVPHPGEPGTIESPSSPASSLAQVLLSRHVWVASVFFTGTFGTLLVLADFWNVPLQQAHGHDGRMQAILNAMLPLGTALGALITGWASEKIVGLATPCRIVAITSTLLVVLLVLVSPLQVWAEMILLFLTGFALGGAILAFPVVDSALTAHTQGTGIGMLNTIAYLGAAITNLVVAGLVHSSDVLRTFHARDELPGPADPNVVAEYQLALIPIIVLTATSVFASLLIRDRKETGNETDSA